MRHWTVILLALMPGGAVCGQDRRSLAEDVFGNIQTFKGKPAASVIPAMDALTGLLGVGCEYCHVPRVWDKDDKAPKQTARKMFDMTDYLDETYFGGQNGVSCWTCHRGHARPPSPPRDAQRSAKARELIAVATADKNKPAEQVFHDIKLLTGTPAGQIPGIMTYFSDSLGVDCSHCHLPGQWDKDTPSKLRARTMLAMVTATVNKFYGGSGPLGCPDCHQGNEKPQFLPPK